MQAEVPGSEATLPQSFRLLVGEGGAPLSIPLPIGRVVRLGSDASADVRLEHASVQARHCEFEARPDGVALRDLGTYTGTFVNGSRLHRPVLLKGGERLSFGRLSAVLIAVPASPAQVLAFATACAAGANWTIPVPRLGDLGQEAFSDILIEELKKVPWLALSALAHLLVLGLAWLILEQPDRAPPDPPPPMALVVLPPEQPIEGVEKGLVEEEVREEAPDEMEPEPREEADTEVPPEELEEETFPPEIEPSGIGSFEIGGGGLDRIGRHHHRGLGRQSGIERIIGSGKFRGTISTMRRAGLEVVIAFDSTGSMSGVIQQATERIDEMISVLQALVPGVRIGLVTYRDHGDEEYVTRACPLTPSRYRLKDFIEGVCAGGGRDIPEAVADALAVAFQEMKWSRSSYRFVILIGDAPPHDRDRRRISRLVHRFTSQRRRPSTVSTIFTGSSYDEDDETIRSFREIARSGKGVFTSLQAEEKILREIIAVVFGRQFESSLKDIFAYIAARRRLGEQERKWILHADIDAMVEEGLVPGGERRISPEVVETLIHMGRSPIKRREVFERTFALLERRSIDEETLWAGRYILSKLTGGTIALNPEAPFTQRRAQLNRLRSMTIPGQRTPGPRRR